MSPIHFMLDCREVEKADLTSCSFIFPHIKYQSTESTDSQTFCNCDLYFDDIILEKGSHLILQFMRC